MTEKNKGKSSIPWAKIKKEYCSGAKLRELERKYGVSHSTISTRIKKEGWKQTSDQISTKTDQKLVEKISDELADTSAKFYMAANLALEKTMSGLQKALEDDSAKIKQYTSILKDLKDIGVFRSELDRAEQMARIEKLRKEAEKEEVDKTIVVEFKGDIDEYSN